MTTKRKRVAWTEEMNRDVLECKERALEIISSDDPPLSQNGRKKGYIQVMKELWHEKGYENLDLTGQNLRDQAARLQKMWNCSSTTIFSQEIEEKGKDNEETEKNINNFENNEGQYASSIQDRHRICIPLAYCNSQRTPWTMKKAAQAKPSQIYLVLMFCQLK